MAQRSPLQLALDLLRVLLVQRTVRQADLAREVGVRSETIRKHLTSLQNSGVPLERQEEGRDVWWSIPKSWVPGGVFITHEDALEATRLLSRTSRSRARDALIKRLGAAVLDPPHTDRLAFIKPREFEDRFTPLTYKSLTEHRALKVRYFTMSRGEVSDRHLSIAAEVPPHRIVARCHRSDTLKWFRIDNIFDAELDPKEPYRHTSRDEVDAFIRASVDGFHANEQLTAHTFLVRSPESRWVEKNLPHARATVDHPSDHPGHLRVTVTSAAVAPIARYVLSLGGAARPESEPLRSLVHTLALDALSQTTST